MEKCACSGSGATLFSLRARKRQSQFPPWVIFHCELPEEWFNVVKQLSAPLHGVFEKVAASESTQRDISLGLSDNETHCSQNQLFFGSYCYNFFLIRGAHLDRQRIHLQ
jgi:hypothetical protein